MLIISHITFGDCHVHIFPTTILEMAVYGIFITWWLYPKGEAWSPWNLSNLGAQTSHFLSFPQDIFGKQIRKNCHTVFPRIISGGDYFFFRIKRGKGGDYSREGDYFSYCSLDAVPKKYIYIYIFFIPLNQAIITSNKLNMGFLSVPNWVPGLIFSAWIITHQFCWIRFHFNFTRRV